MSHDFHLFPKLPPEIRLAIWEIPLSLGAVVLVDRRLRGDRVKAVLTSQTWDMSDIHQVCQETFHLVDSRCQRVAMPADMYYVSPTGQERQTHWIDFSRTTFHFSELPISHATNGTRWALTQTTTYTAQVQYASFATGALDQTLEFCVDLGSRFEAIKSVFIHTNDARLYDDVPPDQLAGSANRERKLPECILSFFRGHMAMMPTRAYVADMLGSMFVQHNPQAYPVRPQVVVFP